MNSRTNLKRWAPFVLVAIFLTISLSVFAAPKKKTTKKKPKPAAVQTNAVPYMPIGTDAPPAAVETPAPAVLTDPDAAPAAPANPDNAAAPAMAPSMDLQLRAMPDAQTPAPAAPAPAPAEAAT